MKASMARSFFTLCYLLFHAEVAFLLTAQERFKLCNVHNNMNTVLGMGVKEYGGCRRGNFAVYSWLCDFGPP
jgi:hypothetical protein